MRPQRSLERYERTQLGQEHPKILDKFNDRAINKEGYLHPTKGYRAFSVKRSRAAMITAEMRVRKFPLAIISWQMIKKILKQDIPA